MVVLEVGGDGIVVDGRRVVIGGSGIVVASAVLRTVSVAFRASFEPVEADHAALAKVRAIKTPSGAQELHRPRTTVQGYSCSPKG